MGVFDRVTWRNGIVLGLGQRLDRDEEPHQVIIPDRDARRHTWVTGTTGSGKTKLIELIVSQQIYRGQNVLILDPKGDGDLLARVFWTARACGRLEDLIYISPIFPQYSARVNPLSHHYMTEELVSHIISGVDIHGEKFFYNVALDVSSVAVSAYLMIARHKNTSGLLNLNDVKNLVDKTDLQGLYQEVSLIGTPQARQLARDLQRILDKPVDYYAKISSSLSVALGELSGGNIGQIVGTCDTNPLIERLEEGRGVIALVQFGSMLTDQASFTLGKVILSMIKSFVGRRYASGKKVTPPLNIHSDEAARTLFLGIETLLAQGGSAGLSFFGYVQSLSQIAAVLGPDVSKSILDNTNTKIFLRVPDPESAEYASSHFGTRRGYSAMCATTGRINFSSNEEEVILPQDVAELGPQEMLVSSYIGKYRVLVEKVDPVPLRLVLPEASSQGVGS